MCRSEVPVQAPSVRSAPERGNELAVPAISGKRTNLLMAAARMQVRGQFAIRTQNEVCNVATPHAIKRTPAPRPIQ